MGLITASIVSHGQGGLLPGLLADLVSCPEVGKVILVRNIPEPMIDTRVFEEASREITLVENSRPRGFSANHNTAFSSVDTPYFLVLNPDVRLRGNPFPGLLACMADEDIALCAPAVVTPSGEAEDSVRGFPTPIGLFMKLFGMDSSPIHAKATRTSIAVPWVAGMFMLFRRADYAALGGFDEEFYLYYEDVDICARLWNARRKVAFCPGEKIIHDARRASRHDLRYTAWHVSSIFRYFRKHGLRPPRLVTP